MTVGRRVYRQVKQSDGTSKMVEIVNPSPRLSEDLRFDGNFISPIDGTEIKNKYDLQDHNKRHEVIQLLPGMDQDIQNIQQENIGRITGQTGKEERIEAIRHAIEKGEHNA